MGLVEARGEKRRRHDITDAQGGHRLAAALVAADIKQRVRTKSLGQAAEQHGIQVEVQQLASIASGLLAEVIGEGADRLLQRHDEQVRRGGVNLIGHFLVALKLPPVPADTLQRRLHHARRNAP